MDQYGVAYNLDSPADNGRSLHTSSPDKAYLAVDMRLFSISSKRKG